MGTIICLLGKSGTGKDTLLRLALEALPLRPLVPYTTRPRRSGEREGAQYHFVTEEEMDRMAAAGQIIERRSYDTVHGVWHYFTAAAALAPDSDYILITTPAALPAIVACFGTKRVVAVLLEAGDQVRLERSIRREAGQPRPDFAEVCRRYLSDEADFAGPLLPEAVPRGYIDADHSPEDCLFQLMRLLALSADENGNNR